MANRSVVEVKYTRVMTRTESSVRVESNFSNIDLGSNFSSSTKIEEASSYSFHECTENLKSCQGNESSREELINDENYLSEIREPAGDSNVSVGIGNDFNNKGDSNSIQ